MSLQYIEQQQPEISAPERDYIPSTVVHIRQHLKVDKPDTIMKEKVHITAAGLRPYDHYKMTMNLKHKYGSHKAYAIFKTDGAGIIDLATAKPLRGTYSDADGMGLFLSQMPSKGFEFGGYLRCTPPVPFVYELQLQDASGKIVDTVYIKKHWMHPRLERTEIEEDGICGTLFKPPGEGPFPTIIDISGTGGGLHEHKGAALASEGFVVLCLAFFQYKTLVDKLEDVEMEYFKKAVDWLISKPYTNNFIGIQGVSFGATLVDLIATRNPEIKAVVSINGAPCPNMYARVKENGESLKIADADQSKLYFINQIMCSDKFIKSSECTEETRIPFERCAKDVAFRFVASVDDLVITSALSSQIKAQQLRDTGRKDIEIDYINGGHIMEPPYFPHHDMVYAKFQGFYCGYGGEVALHGKSQEGSWQRTVDFFKLKLGEPPKMPEWGRLDEILQPSLSKL